MGDNSVFWDVCSKVLGEFELIEMHAMFRELEDIFQGFLLKIRVTVLQTAKVAALEGALEGGD